jgi:hypothetical protein
MNSIQPIETASVLVVGVARNCAKTLQKDIDNIRRSLEKFAKIEWMIVESDSTDNTLGILEQLKKSGSVDYISFGKLIEKIPKRTERIAFCRNGYIDLIRNSEKYSEVDFIAVADLDGVNNLLNSNSIVSCWDMDVEWDACFANQAGPYYDIWALRHPDWSPNDCWKQVKFMKSVGLTTEQSIDAAVYSKMITVPIETSPIMVTSAFGGFGLYKKHLFENLQYDGLDSNGQEVCEHVAFHEAMVSKGAKLLIVPAMINGGVNDHTLMVYQKKAAAYIKPISGKKYLANTINHTTPDKPKLIAPEVTVFCAVWHKQHNKENLLRSHYNTLLQQDIPLDIIYVFDNGDAPPEWLKATTVSFDDPLTVYEAWSAAIKNCQTDYIINLNMDDRLAFDAIGLMLKLLKLSNSALIGGEWAICFDEDHLEEIFKVGPVAETHFVADWPPQKTNKLRLGSGTGERGTFGPSTLWDLSKTGRFYPTHFDDGEQIKSIGDALFWHILKKMGLKSERIPLVIGKYFSDVEHQAEFRVTNEWEKLRTAQFSVPLKYDFHKKI